MNTAFLCIFIAALMPFVLTLLAKAGGHTRQTPYDNRNPRGFLANLSGWPARANAAQQNSWEALAVFAPAVLMATVAGVNQQSIDFWAMWFIGLRLIYAALYIADWSALRSVVWFLALVAPAYLMIAAL